MEREELGAYVRRVVPFWSALGLELTAAEGGRGELAVVMRPEHRQGSVMHGGVMASLLDSACAAAALSLVYPQSWAATVNLQVAYVRPVTAGRVVARAECVKAGRTVLFCEARAFDDEGAIVATASAQLVRAPFPEGT